MIIAIFISVSSEAKGGKLFLDSAIGYGAAEITNPDGSVAYYDTINVWPELKIPAVDSGKFGLDFGVGARYMGLENRANGSTQSEFGQHFGYGANLELRAYRFFVGYSYYLMSAKQSWSGTLNQVSEFDYNLSGLSAGFSIPVGKVNKLALVYTSQTATYSGSDLGLSADPEYTETVFWLRLKMSFGSTPGKAFGAILGK